MKDCALKNGEMMTEATENGHHKTNKAYATEVPHADNPLFKAAVREMVKIPIKDGKYTADFITFHDLTDTDEHFAIGLGSWRDQAEPLVRVHSECLTGDTFGSTRCDCGPQLDESLEKANKEGGLILYMRQEGRGIGLYNKLDAYRLQDKGYDTYEANQMLNFPDDMRSYVSAAQMLIALGIKRVNLLSNNPKKSQELSDLGIEIVKKHSTGVFANQDNMVYLLAKRIKTAHNINLEGHCAVHSPTS